METAFPILLSISGSEEGALIPKAPTYARDDVAVGAFLFGGGGQEPLVVANAPLTACCAT